MKGILTWLLTAPDIARGTALTRMERLGACAHFMASAESLARPEFRSAGGLNNWDVIRDNRDFQSSAVCHVLDVVGRPGTRNGLDVVRLVAAGVLILPGGSRRRRLVGNATLATTSALMNPGHRYGGTGSDHASFFVQSSAALARTGRSPALVDACLWAAGLQGTLAYASSGWAKIAGPTWRRGEALEAVTRTVTYGDEWAWKLARKYPAGARLVGASVLALECSTPLVYLAGGRLARLYTLGLTAMHLGIAKTMALGQFVPSFLAMHPGMHYTARRQGSTVTDEGGARVDLVPKLAGTAALGLVASATLRRRRIRAAVQRGRGDEEELIVTDGSRLCYRRTGRVGAPGSVYVLESGLLATPEHWEWILDALGDEAEVVTYQRAGYGASTAPAGTGPTIDETVTRACELVEHVAEGRDVVLVGHSLGGYLALRTAQDAGHVCAVVVVDSSHPQEVVRSPRRAEGAERLSQHLAAFARSLELGCGSLLEMPAWVRSLPETARPTALAQYRDSRLWRAGSREWAAALDVFRTGTPIPRLDVPVLSVSAERNVAHEEVQLDLHRELAEAGAPGSRHEIVPGADHDTILVEHQYAVTVARLIHRFVVGDTERPAHESAQVTS